MYRRGLLIKNASLVFVRPLRRAVSSSSPRVTARLSPCQLTAPPISKRFFRQSAEMGPHFLSSPIKEPPLPTARTPGRRSRCTVWPTPAAAGARPPARQRGKAPPPAKSAAPRGDSGRCRPPPPTGGPAPPRRRPRCPPPSRRRSISRSGGPSTKVASPRFAGG